MRRLRAAAVPYLLILPGGLWLVIFFVVPVIALISLSTQQGDVVDGFTQTFHFANYATAWDNYHQQFLRSLLYGGLATILCIVLAYPMAYWIAFRGGARKSMYLFLILLPFFVSFLGCGSKYQPQYSAPYAVMSWDSVDSPFAAT